jgi:predicted transcriptional regulator
VVKIKKSMLFEAVAVLLLLFLIFILYVMVTTGGPSSGQWTLSGLTIQPDTHPTMLIGPADELYLVNGEYVNAISPAGKILWRTKIPNDPGVSGQSWWVSQEEFDGVDGDIICLLLFPEGPQASMSQELVVLATNGRLLWSMLLNDTLPNGQPNNAVSVRGGRIYLQSGSYVTVYDRNGMPLWKLTNIYYQPSVGEDGTLYVAPDGYSLDRVEAYSTDGTMKWSHSLENESFPAHDTWQSHADPIYSSHTVYVQQGKSLVALNEDGSLRWKKLFNASRFFLSPIEDGRWSVTMNQINGRQTDDLFTIIISPDGSESASSMTYEHIPWNVTTSAVADGIVYYSGKNTDAMDVSLDDLSTYWVAAHDAASGDELWRITIEPEKRVNATLNESTVGSIMYQETLYGVPDNIIIMNRFPPEDWYRYQSYPNGYKEIRQNSMVRLIPWDGGVYVKYWAYNYEYPFFFDRSRCVYGGGLYALDRNGTLLWEAPTGSEINNIVVNNSTVYYSTRDGKLSASTGNAVAGMALTAAFYLFIRFFLAGAVTRARGLVDKNENRNSVLKYIASNPGASLYDISQGLKVNMGTVRYHLMILGINHRIVSCKVDDKYVRYFTNAGSYSREQQFIVALMKRDGLKKALNALLEKPGISNAELSREIGVHESAASRLMKELVEKGVVSRETGDGRLSYSIKGEYRGPVAFAMERLAGR